MMHTPKVRHAAADAISRHPISDPIQLQLPDDVATITPTVSLLAITTTIKQNYAAKLVTSFQ